MAKKSISVKLDAAAIGKAIKGLNAYNAWVKRKTAELMERLATIGAMEATVRFSRAYYDGEKDVSVSVEPIPNGWKIVAAGQSVCFLEFGAGVYYNGSEPYPSRPPGVDGIGEYGQGKGKQNTWGYYAENGDLVLTHGTPAAMPMLHASRVMEKEIMRIAREVFG